MIGCREFLCLTLLISQPAIAGWESLPPLPEPNGGFACGFLAGRLIVAGGTRWQDDEKHWLDTIRCYEPKTAQWSTLGQLPHAWAYGACGVIHDHLILAGGTDGKSGLLDILALDADGQCQRIGDLPKGLIFTSGTVLSEQLIMASGATDPVDLTTFTGDGFLISITPAPLHATATPCATLEGRGFGIGTAAPAGNRMFIFGGTEHDPITGVKNIDTLRVLDHHGHALPTSNHLPTAIRGATAIALAEGVIYLVGGYPSDEAGFTDQTWLFDAATQAFTQAKPLPIKSIVHLARDGDWLYALGGEDQKKHRSAAMWRIRVAELLAR